MPGASGGEGFFQIREALRGDGLGAFLDGEHFDRHDAVVGDVAEGGGDGAEVDGAEAGTLEVGVVGVDVGEVAAGLLTGDWIFRGIGSGRGLPKKATRRQALQRSRWTRPVGQRFPRNHSRESPIAKRDLPDRPPQRPLLALGPRSEPVLGAGLLSILTSSSGSCSEIIEFNHPSQFCQRQPAVAVSIPSVVTV